MTTMEQLYDYCRLERNTYERKAKYLKAHADQFDMNESHKRAAAEAVVYAMSRVLRRIKQIEKDEKKTD